MTCPAPVKEGAEVSFRFRGFLYAVRGNLSDRLHSRLARIEPQIRRLCRENPLTSAEQVDGLTVQDQRRTPLLQRPAKITGVLWPGAAVSGSGS